MDAKEQLILKLALETLAGVSAGLRAESVLDQAERMYGQRLTTEERQRCLNTLVKREWVYSYRDEFIEETLYAISSRGRMALQAL